MPGEDRKTSNNTPKPGKSGAARPPVIDVQARKVDKRSSATASASGPAISGSKEDAARSATAGKTQTGSKADAKAAVQAGKTASATTAEKKDGKSQAGKSAAATSGAASTKKPADSKKADPQQPASGKAGGKGQPDKKKEKKRSGTGWKLLLGLLLLGGAAGGGAWVYQQYGPQKTIMSLQQRLAALEQKAQAAAPAEALKALQEKLAQVQQQQQQLAASLRELQKDNGGDLPLKVQALEEKLGQLEKLAPALRENAERTAALEKTLASLQQQMTTVKQGLEEMAGRPAASLSGNAGGDTANAEAEADGTDNATTSTGAGTGAATATTTAASAAALLALKLSVQELQQKLAALNEQVAALRSAADPARLEALEGRIGKQEQALIRAQEELRTLAQKAQVAAERAAEQAAAATQAVEELRANPPMPKFTPPPEAVAYAALRQKALSGTPFQAELDRLATLMPGEKALDALQPYAAQAVPTADALAGQLSQLQQALKEAQRKATRPEGDDPLSMLKGKLMGMVKVRRAGEVDWLQALADAQAALARGGLAAAVAVLAPLQEKDMPQEVAQWLAQARARLAVNAALDALADAVLQRTSQRNDEAQ